MAPHTVAAPIAPLTPSVEVVIAEQARLYGVDARLATTIAKCENPELNPLAKNPNSSATGIFQFLKGTWEFYGKKHWGVLSTRSVKDADDNIELAMWVMGNYGTADWEADPTSYACWGKMKR